MTNTIFTKAIAGLATAALLLPFAASAHSLGLSVDGHAKVGVSIGDRIDKALDRIEHKGDTDTHKDERTFERATTTAAKITAKATRVQVAADSMLSFEARVAGLISSSTIEDKTAIQAKFDAFKSGAISAKTEAGNAISVAGQVNATNSTTTNASLLAQAKIDLREARNFLKDATQALFSVLRSLWK